MKRIILLAYILTGFSILANAQCKTCKQGAHNPKDPSIYFNQIPYSLYAKMPPAVLNGNHTLGQSYIQQDVCGLNYMTASLETTTRATWQPGSGFPAKITLTGCLSKSVQKAFAYWDASYTEATPPATSITLTNPTPTTNTFSGTLIGTDVPKCWGETGTASYRADVTSIINQAGSYTINSINGFNNAGYEVDGVSIIVIYTSGAATYSGSIALYDGCYTGIGTALNYTATGFSVCANSSLGAAFGIFGDMQNNLLVPTNTETFNGSTATFPNSFWNYDSIPTSFTSGQSSSVFNSYVGNTSDCYTWVVAGLYWQNTNCITCAPKTLTVTTTKVDPTCGTNNGSITVGVTGGTAPYTYSWSPNVSTNSMATGLSVGVYVVTVTDSTGCNAATDTVILVNPTGPTLTTTTTPLKCFGGSGGTASVTATGGTPAYTYSWSPGGQTTTSITGLTAGSYTILVTDSKGCQSVALANVNQPPPFSVGIDSLLNVKCNGGNNGAIYVTGMGGTPTYTYSWSNGNTTTSLTGLSTGSYKITITDANGCISDTTLSITQPAPMAISVTSYDATCGQANGSAWVWNVTGGTGPYTYKWSNGYPGSFNFGLSAGTYCVTVNDANGCQDSVCVSVNNIVPYTIAVTDTSPTCYGGNNGHATVIVTGGGSPWTYKWTPTNQTTAHITNLTAATYTITVTDNSGCASTDVITLTQPPQLSCSLTPKTDTICIGQSVNLTATASGGTMPYTYTWDNSVTANPYTVSPVTTTSYTVVATDSNGCASAPQIANITVNKPITVSISPNSAAACAGDTTTFTATATGGDGNYSYTWSPGGKTGSTVTLTTLTTTIYTVTVTDNCGSPAGTASVKVTINPSPVAGFVADSVHGCSPVCIQFTDTSSMGAGGNIASWKWTFGDGGTDTVQNPNYCYNTPGVYTVSLTVASDSGCTSSKTIKNMISIYSKPIANFTLSPQPTTIMAPKIYFTDHSTDQYGIASWLWTFGDNLDSISSSKNTVHTYADTGTFCATLRVINLHGCSDSTTNCLVIDPQYTLYIPDAFTPNGNGLNDIFLPKGEALNRYDLYIFDRWGQLLFHSNDIMKGWDGTIHHRLCQEDTYVYLITILDNYNKKHTYIGKVTLIR